MGLLANWADALLDVVFPRLCPGCNAVLLPAEKGICLRCLATLPRTGYHQTPRENPLYDALAAQFAASQPPGWASAWLFFESGGKLQHILHSLKYENQPQLAYVLGQQYGHELAAGNLVQGPAQLVPIPLHPRKQRERSYNQSEHFAAGLAAVVGLPVNTSLLRRMRYTQSQTGKNKAERQTNVADAFAATQPITTPVVLIDDVVTTGATVSAAAQALLGAGCPRVSVLALAYVPVF
jgi:ComF family protein